MTICEGCKFAEWVLTSNGRRHPSGQGKCTWEKTFHIAASALRPGAYSDMGEPFTIKGGWIDRKRGPAKCDMVQKG
jgi:hypothetical protein